MAKPDLGKKRICLGCGARFYDLNHDPITCPKCEAVLDLAALARASRPKPPPAPKVEKVKVVEIESDEDILDDDHDDDEFIDAEISLDDDDDEEDDDLIEDASELGEDKDDLFVVIDTVEEKTKGEEI